MISKIIRRLYTFLFLIAIPVLWLRLLIRSRQQPAYRCHIKERFGFVTGTHKPSLWIHSVSVGETIAAIPLITQLITLYPTYTIHVTTTTPTGREQVLHHFGDQVSFSYLPYDISYFLQRFIKNIQPRLSIIMETEIWPNLLAVCHKNCIPTLLANARLSEKSYRGYARLKNIAHDLFNLFSNIAAQSELDAHHFKELGVAPSKITITGNLKFDRRIDVDSTITAMEQRKKWQLTERPVIIAASTRDGEEPLILTAYKQIKNSHPDAFLILVPRHPERADAIVKLCKTQGLSVVRSSEKKEQVAHCDILLGDTIGQLFLLYAMADVAYVGGSLVNTGCHNVLEPAALHKPIITGPYLRNFKAICAMLQQAHAQIVVHDTHELVSAINHLIAHPDEREAMGQRAFAVYESNQGATQKHLTIIQKMIQRATC